MSHTLHRIEGEFVAKGSSAAAKRPVSALLPTLIVFAAIAFIGAVTLGVFA
ncbi:hypothetical protein ACFSE1_12405 [Rhizobium helianthi]|uniref:ABC transporter permease n=1 Tax=Rhizobium helianthi TaxID=1132695 RepID=A0ABW4M5K9_9HYPH